MIIDAGAYPSPLGYGGFPKSVCTSVNECMCHGIPDSRQLQVCQAYIIIIIMITISNIPFCIHSFITTHNCHFLQNGDIVNIDVTVYLDVCFSLSKILFRCIYRCYDIYYLYNYLEFYYKLHFHPPVILFHPFPVFILLLVHAATV